MSNSNVICALTVAMFVLAAAANAEPLGKRGNYSGVYGWYVSTGETVQVDKDHSVWGGAVTGAFRNDAGSGFLHAAIAVCTFSGEFKKDAVTHNNGDCVVTDRNGDKASFSWRCTTCPGAGELRWTGGTGKYAGITGRGTYQQTDAGPPGSRAGWSAWKGEWELP